MEKDEILLYVIIAGIIAAVIGAANTPDRQCGNADKYLVIHKLYYHKEDV